MYLRQEAGEEPPAGRYRCAPSKGRGRNRLLAGADVPLGKRPGKEPPAGSCRCTSGKRPRGPPAFRKYLPLHFRGASRCRYTRPTSGRFGLRAVSPRRCLCRDIPFRSFGLQNAALRWTAPHPAKKMQSSEFCGDCIWGMFTRTKPPPQPIQK